MSQKFVSIEHVQPGNLLEVLFEVCPFLPILVPSQAGVSNEIHQNVNDLALRDIVE